MSIKNTDWLPCRRDELVKMANKWDKFISDNDSLVNIPEATVSIFKQALFAVKQSMDITVNPEGIVTNAIIRTAFKELIKIMRDIKKRYFYSPPLSNADFVALGLKPRDTVLTNIAPPTAYPVAEVALPGPATVDLKKIRSLVKRENSVSEHGVRIHYGIMGETSDAGRFPLKETPRSGNDLPYSVFTKRKSHRFVFPNSRGKEIFFCLRYENYKGEPGPWGTVFNAFIP